MDPIGALAQSISRICGKELPGCNHTFTDLSAAYTAKNMMRLLATAQPHLSAASAA